MNSGIPLAGAGGLFWKEGMAAAGVGAPLPTGGVAGALEGLRTGEGMADVGGLRVNSGDFGFSAKATVSTAPELFFLVCSKVWNEGDWGDASSDVSIGSSTGLNPSMESEPVEAEEE